MQKWRKMREANLAELTLVTHILTYLIVIIIIITITPKEYNTILFAALLITTLIPATVFIILDNNFLQKDYRHSTILAWNIVKHVALFTIITVVFFTYHVEHLWVLSTLYLLPLVLISINLGQRWGLAFAALALGSIYFFSSTANLIENQEVEMLLVLGGIFFLVTWLLGGFIRVEKETTAQLVNINNEQIQAERDLQDAYKRLDEIIEFLPDATFVINNLGHIMSWNKAVQEMTGIPKKAMIGKGNYEYAIPFYDERKPILIDMVLLPCSEITRYKINYDKLEWRGDILYGENYNPKVYSGKGAYLWVTASKLYDSGGHVVGAIATLRDITERKQIENALSLSEKRYRQLIDNANEAIIVVQNNSIEFANPMAFEMFGYSKDKLASISFSELIHPDDKDAILKQNKRRMSRKNYNNYRILTNHGIVKWIVSSVVTIDWEGKPASLWLMNDITEHKIIEEEIIKADKLESIGILAGGIAHDFNNFLAILLGNITLAKLYNNEPEKIVKKLDNIEKATLRAKDLSNQLFTFAKGAVPVKKEVDIKPLIIDSVNFSLSGTNVCCNFLIDEELNLVEVDDGQISQVFNNIVINAVQSMPDGGSIEVMVKNVMVKAGSGEHFELLIDGRYVKISIKDQGIGIPEEYLNKIFDPFFTTKTKGSGIGLAISYSIIKKHNGYLKVESEKGVGTTFFIYLPAIENTEMIPSSGTNIYYGLGKILVMDDEEDVLIVTKEMLYHLGYEVTLARNGREAIELYMSALKNNHPFDVVIMDLTIPGGIGGKNTIKELLIKDPNVKSIVCSGYSNDPVMANFNDYGFKGVIKKPFTIDDLSKLIYEIMDD